MRFSLVIKPYNDTITEYVSAMDARTDVILEGRECLVNGLKALGGTRILGGPLDLFDDETIELTREIKDLSDLSSAHTDFTQQFTIPSTPNNDPIFQNYYDENILVDGWNAFLKLDTTIYVHGLPVFGSDDYLKSARITSTSFQRKTRTNDKLIQYTIELEVNHGLVNKIVR